MFTDVIVWEQRICCMKRVEYGRNFFNYWSVLSTLMGTYLPFMIFRKFLDFVYPAEGTQLLHNTALHCNQRQQTA